MIAVLIISLVTSAGMIAAVLVKPSVRIGKINIGLYWVVALVGAVVLIAAGFVNFGELGGALLSDSAINPVKILVLFISMTVLSIFLDEIGFFKYIANVTMRHAKSSQMRIFIYLYIIVSVLTVFTSNDIIVLTFTPFICYFAKNAKISPVPYLVGEFVAANTWSMLLIIGNPTNIYIATTFGIDFLSYMSVMALPALFAGLTSFGMLLVLFRKKLSEPISPGIEVLNIKSKPLLVIGLVHLGGCIVLLTVSSYIGLEMWLITLGFMLSLFICTLVYKLIKHQPPRELWGCVRRAPWELIPFLLSMFVIVLAVDKYGITGALASFLSGGAGLWSYGLFSTLFSNVINNIPMSVLFSSIISAAPAVSYGAVYASVIGSNIGAILTPVGALAGIMWMNLLKTQNVKFSFLSFVRYGVAIALPTLAAALGGLCISILWV